MPEDAHISPPAFTYDLPKERPQNVATAAFYQMIQDPSLLQSYLYTLNDPSLESKTHAFHDWASKHRISEQILDQHIIRMNEVEQYLSHNAKEILQSDYGNSFRLSELCTAVVEAQAEEDCLAELKKVKDEAYDLLKKYDTLVPGLVPDEPTELVMATKSKYFTLAEGSYLGKFNNNHYINIKRPDSKIPYQAYQRLLESLQTDPSTRLKYRMTLVHELIHQRHAEYRGQEEFLYPLPTLDRLAQGEDYTELSPVATYQQLSRLKQKASEHLTDEQRNWRSYRSSFLEGATICTSIMIAIFESFHAHDSADRQDYWTYASNLLKRYDTVTLDDMGNTSSYAPEDRYNIGYFMVRKMFDNTPQSIQAIAHLYQQVNLRKLFDAHITKGSRAWKKLMRDPWNELQKFID